MASGSGRNEQPPQGESLLQQLKELQEEAATLQAAALRSEEERAEAAALTASLSTQAVLVAAYNRRLARLATLLQQYDANLQQALSSLCMNHPGTAEEPGAAEGLEHGLRQLEQQLAAAAMPGGIAAGGSGVPSPEALLRLVDCSELATRLAAAPGSRAVLAALEDGLQADLATVNSWPGSTPPSSAAAGPAGPVATPAFAQQQQEQKKAWEAAEQRRQQLEQLRAEVADARQALDSTCTPGSVEPARAQLAAQQGGLRAELEALDSARRRAQSQQAAADKAAAEVEQQQAGLAELAGEEAELDGAIRAMCAADSQIMRQWRRDSWQAQEFVDLGVLAHRQPLQQLSQQLLEAQRQELAAFKRQAASENAVADGAGAAAAAQGSKSRSRARAAAQLLDPLAHLKTGEQVESLLRAASSELAQLQPVQQQWSAAAAASGARLAELQRAAEELQKEVENLHTAGSSGTMQQLQEAAAAAAEGEALVGRTRQALTEWWTSPALTATPWVKHEGKTAEEWLRLLWDQQRAQRQREAFTGKDHTNRIRAAVA